MSVRHYWNEIDPYAAAWIRNLIDRGILPPGDVDTRSIKDVTANDVRGYRQCHFFAGIGGWSLALQLAGWPADRHCWTGSCPCQPFSAAGKQKAQADERHLWPDFFRLIRECKPVTVFGEQVSSAIRHGWLDGISADLEGAGYAVGSCVFGAHSVGAPHIRQRLWWVADAELSGERRRRLHGSHGSVEAKDCRSSDQFGRDRFVGGLAIADGGLAGDGGVQRGGEHGCEPEDGGTGERVEHTTGNGRRERRAESVGRCATSGCSEGDGGGILSGMVLADFAGLEGHAGHGNDWDEPGRINQGENRHASTASGDCGMAHADRKHDDGARHGAVDDGRKRSSEAALRGFWDHCDLIPCRDGKARRIEPGLEPLAHGVSGRVGLLRGYGNAIVPQAAEAFIRAYCEANGEVTCIR